MDRLRSLAARWHPRDQPPARLAAAVVSVLAGLAVYAVATGVFPHHSMNHDEGVYLQQAHLLLDGQLSMHAGELADAVRPWFFVDDGGRLYPKYQPYPAALYALAIATLGAPRAALALVGAANAALVYVLGAAAFDRRVGLLAAVAFATAPMALVTTSTFLAYAPTTTLNLAFAACYLRAMRQASVDVRRSVRTATLAGAAIGLAFFARPYTAVLFAAPFVVHTLWTIARALPRDRTGARDLLRRVRREGPSSLPAAVQRNLATAALGLTFVGVALAYNASQTGSPLTFPYAAFAPQDGPGFGHREILAHDVDYTPALALESNGYVLWYLLTRWGPAGAIGSAFAALGLGSVLWRLRRRRTATPTGEPAADGGSNAGSDAPGMAKGGTTDASGIVNGGATDASGIVNGGATAASGDANGEATAVTGDAARPAAQVLLASLFASVALGNVAFWGNFNVLGDPTDPTDGLVAFVGPIYHFDLLAPLAIFAAAGFLGAWRALRRWRADEAARSDETALSGESAALGGSRRSNLVSRQRVASVALAALLLVGVAAGGWTVALAAEPLERNAEHTEALESAYEPFEDRELDDAVAFVPTPYGPWLNHPFQALRNDDGMDSSLLYAMDRDAAGDFEVVDAYSERSVYRYTYRGEWEAGTDDPIEARLVPLSVRGGDRLRGETTVGVPEGVEHAVVELSTGFDRSRTVVESPGDELAVAWSLNRSGARVERVRPGGDALEPSAGADGSGRGNGSAQPGTANGSGTAPGASDATVPFADTDEVVLEVRLVDARGGTLTYRQEASVRRTEAGVEAIWPPERTVCPLVDDCGRRGTYLPDDPDAHLPGVAFETDLEAT